jgi:hypothetical protein
MPGDSVSPLAHGHPHKLGLSQKDTVVVRWFVSPNSHWRLAFSEALVGLWYLQVGSLGGMESKLGYQEPLWLNTGGGFIREKGSHTHKNLCPLPCDKTSYATVGLCQAGKPSPDMVSGPGTLKTMSQISFFALYLAQSEAWGCQWQTWTNTRPPKGEMGNRKCVSQCT